MVRHSAKNCSAYLKTFKNSHKLFIRVIVRIIILSGGEVTEVLFIKRSHKYPEKQWMELIRVVGSHHQFSRPDKPGTVTVPHPRKNLPIKTVRSIFKQAGVEE
jgi:predicted RNA binding protein YcfA (HicA-like mRNA interferase family)